MHVSVVWEITGLEDYQCALRDTIKPFLGNEVFYSSVDNDVGTVLFVIDQLVSVCGMCLELPRLPLPELVDTISDRQAGRITVDAMHMLYRDDATSSKQ
jgi:hypothetical protein